MKVKVLGTGGAIDALPSGYIVNEHILVDCGMELVKNVIKSKEIEKINTLFLTHLHMDHVSGLELLAYYLQYGAKKEFTIYAGPDFMEFYSALKVSTDPETKEFVQPFTYVNIEQKHGPLNISFSDQFSCNVVKAKHMLGSVPSFSFTFIEFEETKSVRVIISGDVDEPLRLTNKTLEAMNAYCFHDMGWTGVKNWKGYQVHPTEEDVFNVIGPSNRVFGIHVNDMCLLQHYPKAACITYAFEAK